MKAAITTETVERVFGGSAIAALENYIRIPNQSPSFDPEIHTNGLQEKAVTLIVEWVLAQNIRGLKHTVVKDDGRTPVLLFEVPAHKSKVEHTVLLYGHLDKQPPMTEAWAPGLHPHTPVIRDGKLYGRGGADDGYSTFSAITAVKALQDQDAPHPRLVILIEAAEESGSPDLDHYITRLSSTIGNVGLIICLDSGTHNYEQLWVTTSLRGVLGVTLRVDVLKYGVHSGSASGIVPSSFRGVRAILDALEDKETGKVLVPELHVQIPDYRVEEAKKCAEILGKHVVEEFPWVAGVKPMSSDVAEALLNRTWRPTLSVIGADGIPSVANAGNVLRAHTTLKLSFRLPPTCDVETAKKGIERVIKSVVVPCDEKVTIVEMEGGAGWDAPACPAWLTHSLDAASKTFWNKPTMYSGEGGSIPFMGMLGKKFPSARFAIVGVLGPGSNAHGPDEFLHIQFAKNLTGVVAHVIADLGARDSIN